MPVLVYSQLQKDRAMEAFYVEKELIECMDDDLQDLFKNIINGQNIQTEDFVKRWGEQQPMSELQADIEGLSGSEGQSEKRKDDIIL